MQLNPRCVVLAAAALFCHAALAQNLANFVGKVVADTCAVSVNHSGTEDGTVTLDPVLSNNALRSSESVAADVPFTLDLSECAHTTGTMRAHFYNAEAGGVTGGALNKADPAGTGSGWQIALYSSSGKHLPVATSAVVNPQLQRDPGGALDNAGSTRITYRAKYYRNSDKTALIPGTLAGRATYVLYYN